VISCHDLLLKTSSAPNSACSGYIIFQKNKYKHLHTEWITFPEALERLSHDVGRGIAKKSKVASFKLQQVSRNL